MTWTWIPEAGPEKELIEIGGQDMDVEEDLLGLSRKTVRQNQVVSFFAVKCFKINLDGKNPNP